MKFTSNSKIRKLENIEPIILIDTDCVLCSRSASFIVNHEKDIEKYLHFGALASPAAREILQDNGLPESLDSVVYLDKHAIYTESDAIIEISKYLRMPWSWIRFFTFFPTGIRDFFYRFVAVRRYRWFGRRESCAFNAKLQSRIASQFATFEVHEMSEKWDCNAQCK